ncbi:Histidinol-phosphatase [Gammaproteobacteria bacterium]
MALALFDLDNTLLAGDSDYLWGRFLAQQGLVDRDHYERENERFYQAYREGCLDIQAFLRFSLKPLRDIPWPQLQDLRQSFMHETIEPLLLPAARALIDLHKILGDTPVIITATNAFITAPIAARFGVAHLIATEPEWRDGGYTGQVAGVPCFQSGKVTRLLTWIEQANEELAGSHFYSDSHNDLPLLEQVTYPVATDPDKTLTQVAQCRGWPLLSLRQAPLAPDWVRWLQDRRDSYRNLLV